jgi:hypothetical protein
MKYLLALMMTCAFVAAQKPQDHRPVRRAEQRTESVQPKNHRQHPGNRRHHHCRCRCHWQPRLSRFRR